MNLTTPPALIAALLALLAACGRDAARTPATTAGLPPQDAAALVTLHPATAGELAGYWPDAACEVDPSVSQRLRCRSPRHPGWYGFERAELLLAGRHRISTAALPPDLEVTWDTDLSTMPTGARRLTDEEVSRCGRLLRITSPCAYRPDVRSWIEDATTGIAGEAASAAAACRRGSVGRWPSEARPMPLDVLEEHLQFLEKVAPRGCRELAAAMGEQGRWVALTPTPADLERCSRLLVITERCGLQCNPAIDARWVQTADRELITRDEALTECRQNIGVVPHVDDGLLDQLARLGLESDCDAVFERLDHVDIEYPFARR